jgi:hypothetical protein
VTGENKSMVIKVGELRKAIASGQVTVALLRMEAQQEASRLQQCKSVREESMEWEEAQRRRESMCGPCQAWRWCILVASHRLKEEKRNNINDVQGDKA